MAGKAMRRPGVLSYWVVLLEAAVLRSLKRSLAPFKISELQFIILDMCFRGEATTVSSIARLTHYDPSVVSRQTENLRSRGLLQTRRLKRDRRVVELSLTDEARMLREELLDVAIQADTNVTRRLDPGEHDALLHLVRKLVTTLERKTSPK